MALVLLAGLWLVATSALSGQNDVATEPIEVSAADAASHILSKVEPSYPPLAKMARIQDRVKLQVVITENGTVANIKVLSGHPMLVTSAMDAVRQWKYKPFIVKGRTAEVTATVEVPFSLGISDAEYKAEQEASDRYFKESRKCRDSLEVEQYATAESSCKTLVELAGKLPSERQNERRSAYALLGHSLFRQKKFAEALPIYQRELAIAQASLKGHEAELGYAYRDVAHALHATGNLKAADTYYARALDTLEQAREHIGSEFLKNEYSRTIKSVSKTYVLLLRETNQSQKAEALEQKAAAIVLREDLKNPY